MTGQRWSRCNLDGLPVSAADQREIDRFAAQLQAMADAGRRPVPVYVVTCPECGSRDEYYRPDPPEHTCGHADPLPPPAG